LYTRLVNKDIPHLILSEKDV